LLKQSGWVGNKCRPDVLNRESRGPKSRRQLDFDRRYSAPLRDKNRMCANLMSAVVLLRLVMPVTRRKLPGRGFGIGTKNGRARDQALRAGSENGQSQNDRL
jgi:hypothetical protein